MEPLRAGDPVQVGGFALRGRLGAGGMGQVFLAHSRGGRAVAVKVVHPHLAQQGEFRRRFRREAAAARAVSGVFTAPVLAADPDGDPPWIATAYVPGPSLTEAVTGAGSVPLPDGSFWPLAAGLAEALQAIHAEGLLHRDLKPSNVLLAADGPRVIDFGITRALDGTALTGSGATIGTPGFMSPEQAEGRQVGPATDIFALGAVLAFAATGREPFGDGPPLAVLHRVVNNEPCLEGLPSPVHALITACLAKKSADRPTIAQLLDQVTSHWVPRGDFPNVVPWPEAVTTLIDTHATSATRRYTEHPSTASASTVTAVAPEREELARRDEQAQQTRRAAGPQEAARLYAQLAVDYARVLGADHPDTLRSRHSHAWNLGQAGEHVEAARLMADVAVDRARVLGPDHPDTLQSRHSHAWNLGQAGEHVEAARLMADVADDRTRVLGPDHPDTLRSRNSHAANLERAGEHAEAARLDAQLTVDYARVFGPDHPETLQTRHNHAWNLGRVGEHVEAARLMGDVAVDRARVLGPDHPDTLRSRHSHAWNLGQAGEHVEAARLMADVADDRTRVLGPDHPDTLQSRHSHAWNLGRAGEERRS
ncbi:tetratricopeptide repeat protein [Streptomyces sp. RK75]|uniref:serine/threonine-protein kinase n=1 Tax=Streptomyces sp. RK75 TaxID=2824895 RepID=UPI001B36A260|nr:tetratricopeptide repeat protein [Streptomyces sp. RK75]MBQ0864674.1 tetratricopeptide repeat protein [Streptomyces sp. RK75]